MIEFDGQTLQGLIAAVGGGLLVGVERERRKSESQQRDPAGVRSFTLVAFAGAIAALLGSTAFAVAGVGVVGFALVGYLRSEQQDPGLTTEIAMLVAYLLGALSMQSAALAAALFVVLTALLASKPALHRLSKQLLSERELDDALVLAGSVLIVLPLLPDRAIDPWQVLNPRKLWLFAVLVMGLQAGGYVALRAQGPGRGLGLAGFFGGFVSSVATIAAMGRRARERQELHHGALVGALLSNVSTLVQLALLLAAIAPALLAHFALPLAAAALAAAVVAGVVVLRSRDAGGAVADESYGRPFDLRHALMFAAVVGAALLVSGLLREHAGAYGVIAAGAATGLADVHAAAVSIGQLVASDGLDLHDAAVALMIAFAANSVMKCIAAWSSGERRFAWSMTAGVVAINTALFVAVLLS